jgi:(R,R)-butanediol dehydrogenase/meso-butanediol dehydrogenase/diacetyl reductase
MKAVVYHRSRRLEFEELPKPEAAPDQVIVKVVYAGFCGSDHSIIHYDYVRDGTILGHELSGVVVEVGPKARGVAVGDRCVVRTTYCGECAYCLQGRTHLCVNRSHVGKGEGGIGGGFSEYLVAYPQMLIPIPDGVGFRQAAMTEMYASALHGINVTGLSGGAALVMGGGSIGLCTVELLKAKGFDPIVLSEPVAEKRELGLRLGATEAVDPFQTNIRGESRRLSGKDGFDVAFECSGVPSNLQAGLNCLNCGGVLSFVSVIPTEVSFFPMSLMVGTERRIVGVGSSNHEENREVLDLMRQGSIDGTPLISDDITLAELPTVYTEKIDTRQTLKVMIHVSDEPSLCHS